MNTQKNSNFFALMPILIFLMLTFSFGFVLGSVKVINSLVFFMIAALFAVFMFKNKSLEEKIQTFIKGASNTDTIGLIFILLLAGAFSALAKSGGAVDSVVNLVLSTIPDPLLITGLFIVACIVSFALGTSIGTVVALVPIGIGIADGIGVPIPLALAAIAVGATFGDNTSFISDTTISISNIFGVKINEKFKLNIKIVFPAIILSLIIFSLMTMSYEPKYTPDNYDLFQILPFVVVLVLALAGLNVSYVLMIGIVCASVIGIYTNNSFAFVELSSGEIAPEIVGVFVTAHKGMSGMFNISMIILTVGGITALVKENGGINWLVEKLESNTHSEKIGRISLLFTTAIITFFVGSSTVGALTASPIVKEAGEKYGIDPLESTVIVDTIATNTMAYVPWGGMLLVTASTASTYLGYNISGFEIMPYSIYGHLVFLSVLFFASTKMPKYTNSNN